MSWTFFKSNGEPVGTSVNHFIALTSAGAIIPGTAGAAKSQIAGTNFDYFVVDFDKDTDENAEWQFIAPGNMITGDWTITVWWKAVAATTGDVLWSAKYGFRDDDEVLDAALSDQLGTAVTTADTATKISQSTITLSAIASSESGLYTIIRIYRDVSGDDMAEDARLLAVKIEYPGA